MPVLNDAHSFWELLLFSKAPNLPSNPAHLSLSSQWFAEHYSLGREWGSFAIGDQDRWLSAKGSPFIET